MPSTRYQPNILAGPYLNRSAQWRRDEGLVLAALADPQTLIVPVWRPQNLIATLDGAMSARFVHGLDTLLDVDPGELILMGEFRGRICFALEMPADRPPIIDSSSDKSAEFRDLRV